MQQGRPRNGNSNSQQQSIQADLTSKLLKMSIDYMASYLTSDTSGPSQQNQQPRAQQKKFNPNNGQQHRSHNPNQVNKPRPSQPNNVPGKGHRSVNSFGEGNKVVQNFVTKNIYVTPTTTTPNPQGHAGGAVRKNVNNPNQNNVPRNNQNNVSRNNQNKNFNGPSNNSNGNQGRANNGPNSKPNYPRNNSGGNQNNQSKNTGTNNGPRKNSNGNQNKNKPLSAEDKLIRDLLKDQSKGGKSKGETIIIIKK